ncbi:hypothetical protein ACNDC9_000164 [Shigella sonnei]
MKNNTAQATKVITARRKIEMQHEEFQKMTEREQVPLLKSPE